MPADARGDDVYQPQDDDGTIPPNDELDLENTLGERDLDDQMEEGYSPPERPLGVTKFGTTGAEERRGESLDQRLAQEVDDVEPPVGDGIGDLAEGDGEPQEGSTVEPRAGLPVVWTTRPGGRTTSSPRTWASTAAPPRPRKRPCMSRTRRTSRGAKPDGGGVG